MNRAEIDKSWSEADGKLDPNAVIAGGTALLGVFGGLYTSAQRKKAAQSQAQSAAIIAAEEAKAKEKRTKIIMYALLGSVALIVGGVIIYRVTKR
jgi:hypothetical protein